MPFPNPGAQRLKPSCSIRAAGAWVQWGSSMWMSLRFRVLDVWDPGRWEPPYGALVPQGDLGMDFPSQIKAPLFLGDFFPMGSWAKPQQLQAPIQSHNSHG